jgi:molybdate transport system regulatory protein
MRVLENDRKFILFSFKLVNPYFVECVINTMYYANLDIIGAGYPSGAVFIDIYSERMLFLIELGLAIHRYGETAPMEIKHKIWLEKGGRVVFGPGRDGLLKAIEVYKSLHAAAKHLKMSYRAAWGRVKASEERLGMKLVEVDTSKKKGMHLTADAKKLIDSFDRLEAEITSIINKANEKIK